jgi:hypothetical protein
MPAPPGVPGLHGYQARAGLAALAWTAHRTRWAGLEGSGRDAMRLAARAWRA